MADLDAAIDNAVPDAAKPDVRAFKRHAEEAVETARSSVSALASEARERVHALADQQKQAGAEHLAGLAKAAQSAAGDLEGTSPTVARLVRDAATSVDDFAGSLRTGGLREVVSSVSSFARKQPVTFFAGSVLAGLVIARVIKSEVAARSAAGKADETAS